MKNKILDFLEKTVPLAYAERDLSSTYYLNLKNGHSVVLTWDEGFDTKDEHELCVSVRETNSSYFVYDWNILDEDCSLSEDIADFTTYATFLMDISLD